MAPTAARRAPWALLVAFCACLFYALAANGAADSPAQAADGASGVAAQSWLEVALAVVAFSGVSAWLYGNGLRLQASRAGLAGLGLLVAFGAWAGVTIAWSVAPDNSWAEANRTIAYALTGLIGLLLGSTSPRAAERVGIAIGITTVPIALFALGAKTLPGLSIGPLSLDHAGFFNRLSEPLGYWNALALACVTGLLVLLRAAADPRHSLRARTVALLGVYLFALVLGMTYSRGGVIALIAGTAALVALSRERMRTLSWLLAALTVAAAPLTAVLTSTDLTTDAIRLGRREDDALTVFVVVIVGLLVLIVVAWALVRAEASPRFSPARGRTVGRVLARVGLAAIAAAVIAAAVTGAAGRGFDDFRDAKTAASVTDPGRVLSSSSGNRWIWWEEAAGAWADKPVGGWGAGSFSVTHLLYRRQALDVKQPHSVPLQWLAEDGFVGFALALGALCALLAAALARIRSLADAPGERGAAAALFAVVVAWIAQSFFEWSWDIPAVTMPAFVALGVLAARPRAGATQRVGARGPAIAVAAVAFVLVVLSALLPALARVESNGALAAAGQKDVSEAELEDAAADVDLAARLNPLAAQPLIDAATIATRRGRLEEARDYLLRAVRRQPYDAYAWLQLTSVEFDRGDRIALRRAAARALRLDPRGPRTRLFAERAVRASTPPGESATATGAPLVTEVPK